MDNVRRIACIALVGAWFLAHGLGIPFSHAQQTPPNPPAIGGFSNSWDKNLPTALRFTMLSAFNNAAVRDNNTGLVWEKAPSTTYRTWFQATGDCLGKNIGGTTGWRLPSIAELFSVLPVATSVFTGVQAVYWSASTVAEFPDRGYIVDVDFAHLGISQKINENLVWCVRGPTPPSVY